MTEYREKARKIVRALHFDGTFPLDFLGAHESVRSDGSGSGALWLSQPDGDDVRLRVGDWLVRFPSGGLATYHDESFQNIYEPHVETAQ